MQLVFISTLFPCITKLLNTTEPNTASAPNAAQSEGDDIKQQSVSVSLLAAFLRFMFRLHDAGGPLRVEGSFQSAEPLSIPRI